MEKKKRCRLIKESVYGHWGGGVCWRGDHSFGLNQKGLDGRGRERSSSIGELGTKIRVLEAKVKTKKTKKSQRTLRTERIIAWVAMTKKERIEGELEAAEGIAKGKANP
ncbi:hypothetical protein ACLOJK_000035 [Asimina triloba]